MATRGANMVFEPLQLIEVLVANVGGVSPVWLRQKISWWQQNLSRQLGFEHGQKGPPSCPWWADRLVYRQAYLQGMGPSPETPNHRDYYSLIARAVAALSDNTFDTRQALYNRARVAQTVRLNNSDPALSVAEMSCECEALEHAIRIIEVEIATGGTKQAARPSFVAERKVRRDVNASGDGRTRRKRIDDEVPADRSSVVPIREHLRHRQRR
jgi:hypothetical protein